MAVRKACGSAASAVAVSTLRPSPPSWPASSARARARRATSVTVKPSRPKRRAIEALSPGPAPRTSKCLGSTKVGEGLGNAASSEGVSKPLCSRSDRLDELISTAATRRKGKGAWTRSSPPLPRGRDSGDRAGRLRRDRPRTHALHRHEPRVAGLDAVPAGRCRALGRVPDDASFRARFKESEIHKGKYFAHCRNSSGY